MESLAETRRTIGLRGRITGLRRMLASTAGLIGSDYTTKEQAWEMLEGLFNPLAHALTATAITLIAWYNWHAYSTVSSLPAAVIVIGTFGARLAFVHRYRRRGRDARVSDWVRLFATSSLIAALGWGSSLSILLFTTEGAIRFAVAALICAPIQGASARAYAMPGTVILHISIVLGMISVTATAFGVTVAIPLALLYLWYQIGFVSELFALRTRMLKSDYDHRALLSQVTRYNSDLATMNARLSTFALTDGLTGVGNRRDFDDKLKQSLLEQLTRTTSLALLLIDVDHFKRFNDDFGHLIGDECLKLVAAAIQNMQGADDFTARYGGEEFALILPATTRDDALAIAERVRRAVETMDRSALPNSVGTVTVSIGVGIAAANTNIQPRMLLQAADDALYVAKQSGRNCVRDGLTSGQSHQKIA